MRKVKIMNKVLSTIISLSIVLTALAMPFTPVSAAVDPDAIVYPSMDTYVDNDRAAQKPNPTSEVLHSIRWTVQYNIVDDYGNDTVGYLLRHAYFKFDLSKITKPVISAKLVYSYRNTNSGLNIKAALRGVEDDWDENTLVWTNRPALGDEFANTGDLEYTGKDEYGNWIYKTITDGIDITDYVKKEMNENGIVNFSMISNDGGGGIQINSVNCSDVSKRPRIELTFADDSYYTQSNIPCTDSTYATTYQGDKFGETDQMRAGTQGPASWAAGFLIDQWFITNSYMKFDLSNIQGEILGAKLHYSYKFRGSTQASLYLYKGNDDTWTSDHSLYGWTNMETFTKEVVENDVLKVYPADGYFATKSLSGVDVTTYTDTDGIDITDTVLSELSGDKTLSICIRNNAQGGHLGIYDHRASEELKPYITILTKKDMEVKSFSLDKATLNEPGTFTASAVINNMNETVGNAIVILALYDNKDGNKKLISLNSVPYTINAYSAENKLYASLDIAEIQPTYEIKAFLWKDNTAIEPLSQSISIN